MVEVTGVFCCACRELWQDRQQALTKHCASEKHRQNYEVCVKTYAKISLVFNQRDARNATDATNENCFSILLI